MNIDQLLELSPPVALLGVLMLLGFYLKRSPFPSWAIPITLGVLGGGSYPFIADLSKVSFQVANPTVLNVIIGVLIGLAGPGIQSQFQNILERFLPPDKPKDSNEKNNSSTNGAGGSAGG